MRERFFEHGNNDKKAIQRDLEDSGILDPSEWRAALDLRDEAEIEQENSEVKIVANSLVDSFYVEGLERGSKNPNFPLKDKLASLSKDLRFVVFKEWFLRDPGECLWQMDEFEHLPSKFQKDVADYLANNDSPDYWVVNNILKVFHKITDRDLHSWIIDYKHIGFATLAENKSKLPYISDEEILKRGSHTNSFYGEWYDWATLASYIDKFPNVDKNKVIEGCLKQSINYKSGIIILNREKFGLSERQVIDLYYKHKKASELAYNLTYIGEDYHQEIADKCIEEGSYQSILHNAGNFKNVDVPTILNKISNVSVNSDGSKKIGLLTKIGSDLDSVASVWGEQMPQDIVDQFVDENPANMAFRANQFGNKIDKDKLIDMLFSKKDFSTLVIASEPLGIKRNAVFAERLIKEGGAETILHSIDVFLKLPREIYIRLLEINPKITLPLIYKFEHITKDDVYSAIRGSSPNLSLICNILNNINVFDGLILNKEFADLLVENSYSSELVYKLDKFENLNVVDLAKRIVDHGGLSSVIQYLDKFPGLNHQEIADVAIEKGKGKLLVGYFKSFKGLNHREIVHKLIQAGESYVVAKNFNYFDGIADDHSIGERLFKECLAMDTWDIPTLINIFELYKCSFDKTFVHTYAIFGDYFTKEIYSMVREITDGTISSETLHSLGIARSGEAGLNQLRVRIARFKSEILEPSFDAKALRDSVFFSQYYKGYVRFVDSEWGDHDEKSFETVIDTFIELQGDGELLPLPTEFQPSGEIRVNKVDKKSQEVFKYSEQFLSRYGTLRQSLKDGMDLLQEKNPLSHLLEIVEAKRNKVLIDLQEKLQQLANPKAIENLQHRIDELKAADLRSIKDLQDNFAIFAQFGEFHDDLRQLIFYYALQKSKNNQDNANHLIQQSLPSFGDVSLMINFVGHIVNQETRNEYFTNKQSVKAFDGLTSIRALEEEFARAQNQESKGTAALEFLPTRGLLMEFSGHIANACWASKYKSIAKQLPNLSAMMIVLNKGTRYERISGAAMMIETEAINGAKLLVIRGLNPVETLINSLSVEDFVEKFITYARGIAEKAGRQLAIVIDDHSGGSCTNRPVLYTYLKNKMPDLQKVVLKSEADTTFNSYKIVNDTYLI